MQEICCIIEAILFVSGEAVAVKDLGQALDKTQIEIEAALDDLEREYNQNRRGFCLKRFGQRVQLATRADYAEHITKLLQPTQKVSLSQTVLETLAVVAYKQPVTRLDIETVRGVKCDYSVQVLLNKRLIREMGRKEALGRPILYGTTDEFLSHFGLNQLSQLPQIDFESLKPEEELLESAQAVQADPEEVPETQTMDQGEA